MIVGSSQLQQVAAKQQYDYNISQQNSSIRASNVVKTTTVPGPSHTKNLTVS